MTTIETLNRLLTKLIEGGGACEEIWPGVKLVDGAAVLRQAIKEVSG